MPNLIYGCDIDAGCDRVYRCSCNWDAICSHLVVVGCDNRMCVDCGKAFSCDLRGELPGLEDPDFSPEMTQEERRHFVADLSPQGREQEKFLKSFR